jgi:hypothetical protein
VTSHPRPQPTWMRSPLKPPARPLRPLAPREPPTGPLQPPAPQKPHAAPLPPSTAAPHRSKPQERPHVGVGRVNCPANKNSEKYIK